MARVTMTRSELKAVHEIIIGIKMRQFLFTSTANQNYKKNRVGESFFDPCSETGFCRSFVKKYYKKDHRT